MPVGFRSFLSTDPDQSLIETVTTQINRWSADKAIAVDAATAGRHLPDDATAITVMREENSTSQIYRWRRERLHRRWMHQMWRTTITAVEHHDGPGWLWTEVETAPEAPSPQPFMSVPAVLRELLKDLPLRDGRTVLRPEPQRVTLDDLPDLMDCLADETRLGPVYLVSQGVPHDGDLYRWTFRLCWDVIGMGNVFFLADETAEEEFNEMVGDDHAVPLGAMRTYQPNVDLDEPGEPGVPSRHQILGRNRVRVTDPARLAHIIGLAQRDRAARMALPSVALDADRNLSARGPEPEFGAGTARAPTQQLSAPLVGLISL